MRLIGSFKYISCPFGSPGCLWGAFGFLWADFGLLLGPFGSLWGALGLPLAVLWGPCGRFGAPVGSLWGALGTCGIPLGHLWGLFGPSSEVCCKLDVTFRAKCSQVPRLATESSLPEFSSGSRRYPPLPAATPGSGVRNRCSDPTSTRAGGQDDVS